MTFGLGDLVTIVCRDGASFTGYVDTITPDYLTFTNGLAFPLEDIKDWAHA